LLIVAVLLLGTAALPLSVFAQPATADQMAPAPSTTAPPAMQPVIGEGPTVVSVAPVDVCATPLKKSKRIDKPLWEKLVPIAVLIFFITVVVSRLPKVELGHSPAFKTRRLLNWLPLGLTYAFLYMGRYNITQFMSAGGITESQYGLIAGVGSAVYGVSFLLNGPLTDRWGGRITILISALGSAVCNLGMGFVVISRTSFSNPILVFCILYGANMYFQSFGAVSIVKVNAAWFHLRERGTFGGIFGILISLGLFFAFDIGKLITDNLPFEWVFFIPAGILVVFFALSFAFVRNNPSDTGHADFDPGDMSSHDDGSKPTVGKLMWKIVSNPIIFTIAIIELCSGFLRQAILQWGREFGKGIGLGGSFVMENWGVVSCIAGITGGMFAGAVSDYMFQSRRGPVSAVLYALMLGGATSIVILFSAPAAIPWVIAIMSMAIIGVHGMLTATASMDFGGKKNAGVAVGIIDGFVYIGSTFQAFLYGAYLPSKIECPDGTMRANPAAKDIDNWTIWPYAMLPVALVGFVLALRLWNARAQGKKSA
jgi:OPA family glycerol-3-phosphate transporter-like MFS transporter